MTSRAPEKRSLLIDTYSKIIKRDAESSWSEDEVSFLHQAFQFFDDLDRLVSMSGGKEGWLGDGLFDLVTRSLKRDENQHIIGFDPIKAGASWSKWFLTSGVCDQSQMKAWVNVMNQFPSIHTLCVGDVKHISSEWFITEMDALLHITKIEADEISPFLDALERVAARNQLIQSLGIKGEFHSQDCLWSQLWEKRLSDGALYQDHYFSLGILSLFSGASNNIENDALSEVNPAVVRMGRKYLDELFKWIDRKRDFFITRSFPCTVLWVGHAYHIEQHSEQEAINSLSTLSEQYLDSLLDHFSQGGYFPFERLDLFLNHFSDEQFSKLKKMLILSAQYPHLTQIEIKITDDQFQCRDLSTSQYQELIDLFSENKIKYSFQVNTELLRERSSRESRVICGELNNMIAHNRRQSNIKKRSLQLVDSPLLPSVTKCSKELLPCYHRSEVIVRPYKKNGRSHFDVGSALTVEVSMDVSVNQQIKHQQQTQLQQTVQQQSQSQIQAQRMNEMKELEDQYQGQLIGADQYLEDKKSSYKKALINAIAANYFFLKDVKEQIDWDNILTFFWTNAIANHSLPHRIQYVTSSALSKMHSLPQYFTDGLSIDNLPSGFFVQRNKGSLVLCYDETKYVENEKETPLTVKLTPFTSREGWLADLRTFIPNAEQQGYSADEIMHFAGIVGKGKNRTLHYLTELMMGLNATLAEEIIQAHQWCFTQSNRPVAFQDGLEIYALMDILFVEGCEGLAILLNQLKILHDKDQALYQHFKQAFIIAPNTGDSGKAIGQPSIRTLLTDTHLTVIEKLAQLSEVEKKWWQTLVDQHQYYVRQVNLVQLYEGFQYFLTQWPKDVALPCPCPIKGCTNMLVALDRLLSLLSRVKIGHLHDQLNHLDGLAFDQEGAWYAARWEGFHYFHSAMALTVDQIDSHFEKEKLGREILTYKVHYAELEKVAQLDEVTDLTYPIILFHRYLGRADGLHRQYQPYVHLTNELNKQSFNQRIKVKLLPLLAITTTGKRGSVAFSAETLFHHIEEHVKEGGEEYEKCLSILDTLVAQINHWPIKPTLTELTALVKFLLASRQPADEVLALLVPSLSFDLLDAWVLWEQNTMHIDADHFIAFYQRIKSLKQDRVGPLMKMIALVKPPYHEEQASQVISSLQQVEEEVLYQSILGVLTAIDLGEGKTLAVALPDLTQLKTIIDQVRPVKETRHIFPRVAQLLPECQFDLSGHLKSSSFDFSANMEDKMKALNEKLKELDIAPFNIEVLKQLTRDDEIKKWIDEKLNEIKEKVSGQFGLIAWIGMKHTICSKMIEAIESILLADLAVAYNDFPELKTLQCLPDEPVLSKSYEDISKNYIELKNYVSEVIDFVHCLVQWRKKWGADFSLKLLKLLDHSPRTSQLSTNQASRILDAIYQLDVSYPPITLLRAIFKQTPLADEINKEEFVEGVQRIIELNQFSLMQRAKLVEMVHTQSSIRDKVMACLAEISQHHATITDACFTLIADYYHHYTDHGMLNAVRVLLSAIGEDEAVKQIIFQRLSHDAKVFKQLATMTDQVSLDKRNSFLRIVAYSCLSQEPFDREAIEGILKELLRELDCCSQTRFERLKSLYQEHPYPNFNRLKALLAIPHTATKDLRHFVEQYQIDPPGRRTDQYVLAQQFDLSTASDRIKQIRNLSPHLSPDDQFLSVTQAQELLDCLVYVNEVGYRQPLSLCDNHQKTVKDLTKEEMRHLVNYCRHLITHPEQTEPAVVKTAQLEFIALAREAMYRTTEKCPYSTQVISLLNVMLQGGNVFSEIRTGEGKGCITALLAAYKWVQGGAVDVCSANMELARRDQEEFSPFFDYLGIGTALIHARSQPEHYQHDGINYSEVSERSLYQQRMALMVQAEPPKKVACILDEADFIVLDNMTQFRLAANLEANADPYHHAHAWVYPIILSFVRRPEFLNHLCDKQQDIEALRHFVLEDQCLGLSLKTSFIRFSDQQLDRWIDSAYVASQLVEDRDFSVCEETVIREGQEIMMQRARVKINHRENKGASFSHGVQQFLHARLNQDMAMNKRSGSACLIEPEKTYLSAKSAKNFIDDYCADGQGGVLGLTGTVGSSAEIEEMKKNYRFKFFYIPPHQLLQRVDKQAIMAKPGWMMKEEPETTHFRTILKFIKHCKKEQPILLICGSVEAAQKLYAFLKPHICHGQLQLFDGKQPDVIEQAVVDQAGLPGMVTVTTPLLSRGTDIKPRHPDSGQSIKAGLAICDTFIAAERDYGQKIGRSGRNGAKGITQLIVSVAEFEKYGLPIPDSKKLGEVIKQICERQSQENAQIREKEQLFAYIKNQFIGQYIALCRTLKSEINKVSKMLEIHDGEMWEAVQHECYLIWSSFLEDCDKHWKDLMLHLDNSCDRSPHQNQETLLKETGEQLVLFANEKWKEMCKSLQVMSHECVQKHFGAIRDAAASPVDNQMSRVVLPDVIFAIPEIALFKPPFRVEKETSDEPVCLDEPLIIRPHQAYANMAVVKDPSQKCSVSSGALAEALEQLKSPLFSICGRFINVDRKHNAETVRLYLQEILTAYHANCSRIIPNALIHIDQRLMDHVVRFGDDKVKQTVYEVYVEHIRQHKEESSYVQFMLHKMSHLLGQGALQTKGNTDLSYSQLLSVPDDQLWQTLFQYTMTQLKKYKKTWFKARDRKNSLGTLCSEIEKINQESETSTQQKITLLIEKLNAASTQAVTDDIEHDAQMSRWSLFAYRNVRKSRFQETLTKIHDKSMVYLMGQKNEASLALSECSHLQALLSKLMDWTRLSKVNRHIVMKRMSEDQTLKDLIEKVSSSSNADSKKRLLVIYECLITYKKQLSWYGLNRDSELAFKRYLDEVQYRLFKFIRLEKQSECLLGRQRESIFMSNENQLRKRLQAGLRQHRLSELSSQHLVAKRDELVRRTFLVMKQCIEKQFPGSEEILLSQVTEGEEWSTQGKNDRQFNGMATFRDGKGERYKITFCIDSMGHYFLGKNIALCRWPEMKKIENEEEDLAVPLHHKVAV